ncbi:MAG TPA: hypothetical protein G4O17_00910, partial [Dehalococcoidia bacterium]|nr:hypothetical protein [Dehalococcoidia bacterium]
MKKKITKIWGIGLTFVMVVSLMLIAAPTPVAAADPVINEWDKADFPKMGEDGDWFWDPDIASVGPIAEAINGDLYAYASMVDVVGTLTQVGDGTAEWSMDEAYSGSYSAKLTAPTGSDYAKVKVAVSAAFSGFTAPSFYYKIASDAVATTNDIGGTWPIYVRSGETVTNGYLSPYPVINISDGVTDRSIVGQPWAESTQVDWTEWDNTQASGIYGEALWHDGFITDPGIGGGVPAFWGPLSYWTETAYPTYNVVDVGIGLGFFAVTGQQSAYVDDLTINGETYCLEAPMLFKSTDGGRTWEETDYADDLVGEGAIVDMVCSSIEEDTLYVTDGNYVYKTDDGGDDWDCLGGDSLEVALQGDCGIPVIGRPITSIDVGYQNEDPMVFIGTMAVSGVLSSGSVYYLDEEAYGAEWTDMDLGCEYSGYDVLSVGCAPDFDDSDETYVVISDGSETWVVYTDGGVCEWHDFAELLWNCETGNSFGSAYASRIGFPDDWEDT